MASTAQKSGTHSQVEQGDSTIKLNNIVSLAKPLSSLPNEILSCIIEETCPEGIQSFSLTCRAIFELARPAIARHNNLKQTIGTMTMGNPAIFDCKYPAGLVGESKHPIEWFFDIWNDPLVARYVKGGIFTDDGEEHEGLDDKMRVCNGGLHYLQCSPYLRRALVSAEPKMKDQKGIPLVPQDVKKWQNSMLRHESAPWMTLLLTILPNLETLYLMDYWDYLGEYFPGIMDVIAKDSISFQKSNSAGPHTFSRLHTVHIHRIDTEQGIPLQRLAPFLALPALKKASGFQLEADHGGYADYAWPYSDHVSAVEEIKLKDCAISADHVGKFLHSMPHLRLFKHSHTCFGNGAAYVWNGGGFLQAVCDTVGSHLETLSLTTNYDIRSLTAVGSLRNFSRLKWLKLSAVLLLGEQDPGHGDEALFALKGRMMPGATENEKGTKFSRLSEILPPSLEELRLSIVCESALYEQMHRVLEDLADWVERDTPQKLRAIYFRYQPGMNSREFARRVEQLRMAGVEVHR